MAKRSRNRHRRRNRKPKTRLPGKILYNILLRLPVDTLLRFKSVCKSWFSLISSRDFIEAHLSKSTNDPHFTHHHLNISESVDSSFTTCSLYSLLSEPAVTDPFEIDHPNQNSNTHYIGVIGYSNGLVCVVVKEYFEGVSVFLWNPSTGTSRRLPKCNMEDLWPTYLFCYDESNNDFKVFADLLMDYGQMLFYSSKSDCWTVIKIFNFNEVYEVVFANGALHGAVSPERKDDSDISNNQLIISFDRNMKTQQKVLQPNYGEGEYHWNLTSFGKSLSVLCGFEGAHAIHHWNLTSFGKSLSVLCGFEGAHADLWVMKNCGREVSWTKLFTIPYMDTLPSYRYMRPLCISLNGQIILQLESLVLLYNSMANTVKVLFDNRIENRSFINNGMEHLNALTWIESLVSPII